MPWLAWVSLMCSRNCIHHAVSLSGFSYFPSLFCVGGKLSDGDAYVMIREADMDGDGRISYDGQFLFSLG